jgi:hypothetical protein
MKFDIFTQRLSSIHDALNFMMHWTSWMLERRWVKFKIRQEWLRPELTPCPTTPTTPTIYAGNDRSIFVYVWNFSWGWMDKSRLGYNKCTEDITRKDKYFLRPYV